MRMRVPRRPIVFFRVRCSILILLIKTVRCSIRYCTFRETGWNGVTGLIWLTIGTTFGFHKTREDPRLAEGLLAAEVEHHCAPFCNVRRPPWASVPSCAVLSERERWFCSGVLYTVVCAPEGRCCYAAGHCSVSTAVECKLRSLYVLIVTQFTCCWLSSR
jgi:hypothetical protein